MRAAIRSASLVSSTAVLGNLFFRVDDELVNRKDAVFRKGRIGAIVAFSRDEVWGTNAAQSLAALLMWPALDISAMCRSPTTLSLGGSLPPPAHWLADNTAGAETGP